MNRPGLWNLLAQGPEEYRPLVEGALLRRFGLILIDTDRKLRGVPIDALNDRWVAIVRDHGPELRGPTSVPHALLRRLAQRATFALSINIDDWKLYRDLARAAEMGARVLVIENDEKCSWYDEWEDFLDEHVPGRLERLGWYPNIAKKLAGLKRSTGSQTVGPAPAT